MKTLTVRLDDELHKEFKIYSTKNGRDMQGILIDYIKKILEDEKEKPNK